MTTLDFSYITTRFKMPRITLDDQKMFYMYTIGSERHFGNTHSLMTKLMEAVPLPVHITVFGGDVPFSEYYRDDHPKDVFVTVADKIHISLNTFSTIDAVTEEMRIIVALLYILPDLFEYTSFTRTLTYSDTEDILPDICPQHVIDALFYIQRMTTEAVYQNPCLKKPHVKQNKQKG